MTEFLKYFVTISDIEKDKIQSFFFLNVFDVIQHDVVLMKERSFVFLTKTT